MTTQAITSPISFAYASGQRSMLPYKLRSGLVEKTRTFKPVKYLYEYVNTSVRSKDRATNTIIKKDAVVKKRKFLVKSSGNGFFFDPKTFVSVIPENPWATKIGEPPVAHTIEYHHKNVHGDVLHTKAQRFDKWGNKLRSKAQHKAIELVSRYYKNPNTFPSIVALRNAKKRREGGKKARTHRADGRASMTNIVSVLFMNVDIHSLRVGMPDKVDKKMFHDVTNESLAAQAGVSTKTLQRNLVSLEEAGIIGTKRQYEKNDDGTYSGRTSRIWFTQLYMKSSGLRSTFNRASESITNKAKKLVDRGVKSVEQIKAESTDKLCQAASGIVSGDTIKRDMKSLFSMIDAVHDSFDPHIE